MNIHLIGNQVTIIGETILHLSSPCLKLIHALIIKPLISILLYPWKPDKEIQLKKYIFFSIPNS